MFALRMLVEKYKGSQKELHWVFVYLNKAYERGQREELFHQLRQRLFCTRESGIADKYVRLVQDMYESIKTIVKRAVGATVGFKVEVGMH